MFASDVVTGALVFAFVIVAANASQLASALSQLHAGTGVTTTALFVALFTGIATPALAWRRLYHLAANYIAVGDPKPVSTPYVIDGDTIDDRATGVRYRLANIDAPETHDNARCASEHLIGMLAKQEAISLVRSARSVTVRATWRWDRFGRRVAFVLVDGEDLGHLLMRRGLAWPWRGRKARWCGFRGALAVLLQRRGDQLACARCHRRAAS